MKRHLKDETSRRLPLPFSTLCRTLLMVSMLCVGATPLLGNSSCAPMQRPPSIEDGNELDSALRGFHKNLRWARYEEAAFMVTKEYEPTFMARYEEYGEDFHITFLELRDVDMQEASEVNTRSMHALVEVEQHWYKEPNMTIKKERYIERWERRDNGWRLDERVEKEEWRAREREKKEVLEAAAK